MADKTQQVWYGTGISLQLVVAILSEISEENVEHAKVRVSRKVCVQELFTCNA